VGNSRRSKVVGEEQERRKIGVKFDITAKEVHRSLGSGTPWRSTGDLSEVSDDASVDLGLQYEKTRSRRGGIAELGSRSGFRNDQNGSGRSMPRAHMTAHLLDSSAVFLL
jgi:hypothetical protein